eukprot:10378232-Heterocapsa_arctica.AAC.1
MHAARRGVPLRAERPEGHGPLERREGDRAALGRHRVAGGQGVRARGAGGHLPVGGPTARGPADGGAGRSGAA